MKIGMAIYSATGNTRLVAKKLSDRLTSCGNEVDLLEIRPSGDPKQQTEIKFETMHDLLPYDMLVFGSFVEAFSLNRCMRAYLSKMDHIPGKKAVMLTTQYFPKKWLGGTQALKKMKALLEAKGVNVFAGEDVNWKSKPDGREERIGFAVDALCEIIEKS